ncbi:MAG: N-6 DNA methylase [Candidatus Eisenbacteria bacterium]
MILPMTVLRRLDAVLEPTKQAVLEMKTSLDKAKIANKTRRCGEPRDRRSTTPPSSRIRDLKSRTSQQQLKADFEAYLDGFSPNVQEILDNWKSSVTRFRGSPRPTRSADALIEKLLSPDINLSPKPVLAGDGTVKHPGLDNHAMGTVFEELVRRFNEENNEEAGEHWTPRDAVKLMAKLIFLPIADQIESGTYLLYDGACGTGGMRRSPKRRCRSSRPRKARRSRRTCTGRRSTPRPARSAGGPAAQGRRRRGGQHDELAREPPTLSNDAFLSARVRLHALESPVRQELEGRPRARMGGKEGVKDPP